MWMLAVQNSDELIYIWSLYTYSDCRSSLEVFYTILCYTIAACFLFEPLQKCMTFRDIFPGLSRTLSFNFQDFPEPKWFSRTSQVTEFSRKKSRTFQEAWEPCIIITTCIMQADVGKTVGVSVRVHDRQNIPVILIHQPYSIGVTATRQLKYTHIYTQ